MSRIADLESAVASGDLASANTLRSEIDLETLSESERIRLDTIDALLRPDRRAIYVAVLVGILLLAVSVKLLGS